MMLVRGCLGWKLSLRQHDDAVAQASSRKRLAVDDASWDDAVKEWRRTKRRRSAWLRDREVAWWDAHAQKVQDASDQGDAFGVFSTFRELRSRGPEVLQFVLRRSALKMLRRNGRPGRTISRRLVQGR